MNEQTADLTRRGRSPYLFALAVALATTAVIAFARSFYLQPFFGAEPLTVALIIHGLCGTAWFALFVGQAWLGSSGQLTRHRHVGAYGPWIAASVIISALWIVAVTAADGRMTGSGLPESAGLFIQLTTTAWFAGLVTAGFRLRQHRALHKRLMILATITMMAPAFSRISRLFRDGGPPPFDSSIFALPFVLALAAYDWRTMRRVHPLTLCVGAAYILWSQIRMPLARSDAWTNFVTPLLTGG